ncbi:MAG: MFS transporter [bacterium]|nr:MFS transporter [bacterium]
MSQSKFSAKTLRTIGLGDLAGQGWNASLSFWSVLFMGFFLFGDQQLLAPNLSRIGAALGFPGEADYLWYIGSLPALLFFVFGGLSSLIIGVASDQLDRKRLLIFCVAFGEACCLLTAFAQEYWQFLLLRTLTGMGLGGFFPVLFSLIGDYFRAENRSTAAGWLELSMGLGIGVGQVLGGFLAETEIAGFAGWRVSFIIMAAPSLPLLAAYGIFARLPRRGASERVAGEVDAETEERLLQASAAHKVSLNDFRRIFASRTNILAILQGLPGTVPWGFIFVYLVDFLEHVRDIPVEAATLLSLVFGICSIFGGLLGGFLGRAVYQRRRAMLPVFGGLSVWVGALPVFFLVNFDASGVDSSTAFALLSVACIVGGFTVSIAGVNIRAILVNTNLPENRGSVFAVFNLADKLGMGCGPFLVGLLLFTGSRVLAYNLAVAFWIPCGLFWLFMARTMVQDEDRVAKILRERAAAN